MISSVVLTKETSSIDFIKIELDVLTGKTTTHIANYKLDGDVKEHVMNKHRIYLPCKIKTDEDFNTIPYKVTLYVPDFWDVEAIGNYTQAILDELYLYNQNLPGCRKSLKEIEDVFMFELIVL